MLALQAKKTIVEEEIYAFSQTESINEMKLDPITRRHRSLSSISKTPSLDVTSVYNNKQCLSESNIPLLILAI